MSHAFGEMIAQNIVCVEVLIPVSEHFAGLDILQSSKTKVLGEGTSREQTLEGRALEELSWDILKIFDLIFLTISWNFSFFWNQEVIENPTFREVLKAL